jgi:hypothetical protein
MTITRGSWATPADEDRHVEIGTAYLEGGDKTKTFRARAWTIDALLKKHRIDHIDLMSIDLEGFELQALRGVKFERVTPRWLVVEERKPEQLIEFLSPWYNLHAQLTELDFLFHAKVQE